MVSGFPPDKLGLLVYCSVRDWTRFYYVIGFENIRIHCQPVIGFVVDLFFSTLESVFKNIQTLVNGALVSFDQRHVTRSPPIEKLI